MSWIDWTVMLLTIGGIVGYGIWRSRGAQDLKAYLLSDKDMKWWTIGLSIMATQASAITFLSTPGQAFDDGMRFVQFYFGMPIAVVIIAVFIIPIFHKLNVYTAYEYLEKRFDLKTRTLGAIVFLISRGIACGMTIYAPAIIMSLLLGWDVAQTCIVVGAVVILYTVSGGTKAVSITQKQQMGVILMGMVIAGVLMVVNMPISFGEAMEVAGKMGKFNVITTDFDPKDRYNVWSGILGGTFLFLSYFGTDQSQVQRYLGGKSIAESRIGLLFNGMIKIPMQFLILFLGAMMFVFYQFQPAPLSFNEQEEQKVLENAQLSGQYQSLQQQWDQLAEAKKGAIYTMLAAEGKAKLAEQERLNALESDSRKVRKEAFELIEANNPDADLNDKDKIFLTFVVNYLPIGLVGLLVAVILSAAMSSTSAELNALATTTVVDIYKRLIDPDGSEAQYLMASRIITLAWGILAIFVALFASELGNLIQAVNLLGSLFYPVILGLFMVAFFMKHIGGHAVFLAGILTEILVIAMYRLPISFPETFEWLDFGFLWYNPIGCLFMMLLAQVFHLGGLRGGDGTTNS
ncbi:MAG: sodium:solute symporter [Bacteroidota bacterium]